MKVLDVLFVLLVISFCSNAKIISRRVGIPPAGAAQTRAADPDWGKITQRVDHFSITDERTWTMRYMNNSQFYVEGGPMFIFLGGEWAISKGYLVTGQMFDMAREHNGYMYYTEHRYYGESFPFDDLSTESLKYLSADQALADIAYFITQKKKEVPGLSNSKVVVVGGSYSGSLATWARLKYPHLITAALSSSAPLHAVEDFYQYLEVVSTNIELNSKECLNVIKEGVAQMEEALKRNDTKEKLEKRLNVCKPIRMDGQYKSYFFSSISDTFSGLIQYAEDGDIKSECKYLLAKNGSAMEQLADYISDQYGGGCIGDYDDFIDIYSGNETSSDVMRQWIYQTCTEYGYYQTSTSEKQPFGHNVPLELSLNMCRDLYGENFTRDLLGVGVDRTNIVYGSITPDVTNVISVHGTVDPWHSIGLLKDLSPLAPAILVNGTSHCADLRSISPSDSSEMKAAKEKVQKLIAEWIK